jgi:peroxiredoxin
MGKIYKAFNYFFFFPSFFTNRCLTISLKMQEKSLAFNYRVAGAIGISKNKKGIKHP